MEKIFYALGAVCFFISLVMFYYGLKKIVKGLLMLWFSKGGGND